MNPIIGAQLLSSVGNVAGSLIGARQSRKNIDRTNRANIEMAQRKFGYDKKMAEYQWSKDMEMWNMMNRYNSPVQQMQRMSKAGLNKHLMYGQGTVGNTSTMPQYNAPMYSAPALDYRGKPSVTGKTLMQTTGAVGKYLEFETQRKQIEKLEIANWLAERTKYDERALVSGNLTKLARDIEKTEKDIMLQDVRTKIEEVKNSFWQKGINPSDASWIRIAVKALEAIGISSASELMKGLPQQAIKQIME